MSRFFPLNRERNTNCIGTSSSKHSNRAAVPGGAFGGKPICFLVLFFVLSRILFAAPSLTGVVSFGNPSQSAGYPSAELIEGSDGSLYGTTSAGGAFGQGTVFRIGKDGSGFAILRSFTGTNDGSAPMAAVIEASDGMLYSSTSKGGQFGFGTVFRMNKDGNNFLVLKNFTGGRDGAYPEARLLEASDGYLYGAASGGGDTNDYGTLFQVSKDGSVFTPLFQFARTNGANPEAGLIEASDGRLYGTTVAGGNTNSGVVFGVEKGGTNFSILQYLGVDYYGTNGAAPLGRLLEGTNGMLFGSTSGGGVQIQVPGLLGTLFQVNKDGTGFFVFSRFSTTNSNQARFPSAELIRGSDGWLYGTAFDGGTNGSGAIFRVGQDGSNYVMLASVSGLQGPSAALLEGSDGLLYGTAQLGGDFGAGGIFKIGKDGTGFAILKSFSLSGGDGASPFAGLSKATDGTLFGTTRLGGAYGRGTVYSVRFDGTAYRVASSLFSTNGFGPLAGVTEASDGLLYGITRFDDTTANEAIFNLHEDGSGLNLLFSSTSASNGQESRGTLVQGTNGRYGTTVLGGTSGQGTVFQFGTNSGFSVLKNFSPVSAGPGANPASGLLLAGDGRLYGTAYAGSFNNGAVFGMNLDGSGFAVLKSFFGTNGAAPISPLLEASDSLLYGTTYGGGATNNGGTVFRMNKGGSSFQVLLTFVGTNVDGRHPCGNLVE
jgi:uncharacterized repeat protein (TIGR03803 family)